MSPEKNVIAEMMSMRNDVQREGLMRFFKTGAGQYGEGDEFLGVKVPQVREVVKHHPAMPLDEIPALLTSVWHEIRLCGLLFMVAKFEKLYGTKPQIVAYAPGRIEVLAIAPPREDARRIGERSRPG